MADPIAVTTPAPEHAGSEPIAVTTQVEEPVTPEIRRVLLLYSGGLDTSVML